jgi:hypothetical protein
MKQANPESTTLENAQKAIQQVFASASASSSSSAKQPSTDTLLFVVIWLCVGSTDDELIGRFRSLHSEHEDFYTGILKQALLVCRAPKQPDESLSVFLVRRSLFYHLQPNGEVITHATICSRQFI